MGKVDVKSPPIPLTIRIHNKGAPTFLEKRVTDHVLFHRGYKLAGQELFNICHMGLENNFSIFDNGLENFLEFKKPLILKCLL